MTADTELDLFRAQVNCAAVLEGLGRPWKLDPRESTRRVLKHRRDEGEVLIITHEVRGWASGSAADRIPCWRRVCPRLSVRLWVAFC